MRRGCVWRPVVAVVSVLLCADVVCMGAPESKTSTENPLSHLYDTLIKDHNREKRDVVHTAARGDMTIDEIINPKGGPINPFVEDYKEIYLPESTDSTSTNTETTAPPAPATTSESASYGDDTRTGSVGTDGTYPAPPQGSAGPGGSPAAQPAVQASALSAAPPPALSSSSSSSSGGSALSSQSSGVSLLLQLKAGTDPTPTPTPTGSGDSSAGGDGEGKKEPSFLKVFKSGSIINQLRHASMGLDGVTFAITWAILHFYGKDSCQAAELPVKYRVLAMPHPLPTPTPTPDPDEEVEAATQTGDGKWGKSSTGEDPDNKKKSEIANAMAPTTDLAKTVVQDGDDAPAEYLDDIFLEVHTQNLEEVKTWGEFVPVDSMTTATPNAIVVSLKHTGDVAKSQGLQDDLVYQHMVDYLRELQSIQDRRRHDKANPLRKAYQSEWISEDTSWPPDNVRAADAGYHVDALTFHDNHVPGMFDSGYAMPNFLRPKKAECARQSSSMTTYSIMLLLLYVLLHLFL